MLYDDQAGRWIFSQFSVNQGIQCVAVSTTSDPLGPYHRYAFTVTPGGANDYPKMGVWDDSTGDADGGQSAYTFTMRDFGGAGGAFSVSAGVMERDEMLDGDPAQFVKFIQPLHRRRLHRRPAAPAPGGTARHRPAPAPLIGPQ